MRNKSETFKYFKIFQKHAEAHTGRNLKLLRTENGGEYLSNDFRAYLADHGIKHQLTVVYTPQQNGVAERMNRTIMNLVRSIMHFKGISKRFWAEALSTVVYVLNRVTSRSLPIDTTPHHIWMRTSPNVSHMRVFRSRFWNVIPHSKVKKLDARSNETIMVRYAAQSKGYKLWDNALSKFVISRDVKFDEKGDETSHLIAEAAPQIQTELSDCDHEDDDGYKSPDQDATHTPAIPLRRSTRATAAENIEFWSTGIAREEDAIARNNTFELVQRERWMHVPPYKYLFKVKVDTPKVQIVAMGNLQVHGMDYNETFAPDVKLTSISIFLATVAVMDLKTGQIDVVTAFLNGDLDIDIFMETPDGFKDPKRPDLIKGNFSMRFEMKDMGEARVCLGLEIHRDRLKQKLHVSQKSYTETVLERFGMHIYKPVATPMEASKNNPLSLFSGAQDLAGEVLYRKEVGSLMYLMVGTRSDLAFAVGKLSQHCEKPLLSHWTAVKGVLRYIADTCDRGLLFSGSQSLVPVGYSDSDWGGCIETRKSTSGFMLAGG
eukprot:IDg21440t1